MPGRCSHLPPPEPSSTLCQGAPTGDPNLKVMHLSGLPAEESLRLLRSFSENLKQAPQAELYALARQCGNIPLALLIAGTLLKNNPSWTPARLADRVQRERTRLGFTPGSKGGGYELEALLNITGDSLGDLLESRLHMLGVLEGPFTMAAAAYIWSSDKNGAQRDMLKLQSYQILDWSDSARSYTIHPGIQSYLFTLLLDKGNLASLAVFRHAVYYLKQVQLVLSGREPARPLTPAEKQKLLDLLPQWRAAWKRMSGQDLRRLPVSERDAWLCSVPEACGEALVAVLSEPEWRGVFDTSLEAARRMGDQPREAKILLLLSRIYHERLDHEWAEMYALQALVLFQQLEDSDGEAETLTRIGLLHQEQGDAGKARDFFARALQVEASQGLKDRAVLALEQLGEHASPAID
jgi:tetratricopeptide (TPR) repeat protein